MSPRISLVVPFLNEESIIRAFYEQVDKIAVKERWDLQIVFVNDGSSDRSKEIAGELAQADERCLLVNFSRNFGKEAALFAGLHYADGDVVVPIDVDLQHPVDLIPTMLEAWKDGADVVLPRRANRMSEPLFKRLTSDAFYVLHNKISDVTVEKDVGDFRLMDRRVVDAVLQMPERRLFMKGIFSWVGFETRIIDYVCEPRAAGASKFSTWKLWNFAIEGITSFSTLPLRLWTYVGGGVAALSLIYGCYLVVDELVNDNPVPGYPSLMTGILFLGGIQLIGIGILGEYIGRIYEETKQRPKYVVSSTVSSDGESSKTRA